MGGRAENNRKGIRKDWRRKEVIGKEGRDGRGRVRIDERR